MLTRSPKICKLHYSRKMIGPAAEQRDGYTLLDIEDVLIVPPFGLTSRLIVFP